MREADLMTWKRSSLRLSLAELETFRSHQVFETGRGSLVPEIVEIFQRHAVEYEWPLVVRHLQKPPDLHRTDNRSMQHAQCLSGNVSQTCRFFGVSRALFYIWKERYEKHGVTGLRDLPRRPHKIRFRIPPVIVSLILRIREERRNGAVQISPYLQRH
jgi:hypothetical protein